MKLPNFVDVSRWQGAVNWATIAAAEVKAAGIRATVGDYYTDFRFLENWRTAKANGIARTAYHVVRPDKPYATQMSRFFAVLADDLGELPVTLDVEVAAGCSAKRINEAVQWCSNHVKMRTDRRPIIYTAKWFADGYCMDGGPAAWLTSHELWIASYPHNVPGYVPTLYKPLLPTGAISAVCWQYTDKGISIGAESKSMDYDWARSDWLKPYLNPPEGYPIILTQAERDAILSIARKLE